MKKPKIVVIPENMTDEQRKKLLRRAYNYCVWSLSNSQKTSKQLSEKLTRKGYTEDLVEETLNKLVEDSYVNDEDFARRFVEYKLNEKGSRAITYDLMRKGIDRETIEAAFSEVDDLEELEEEKAVSFALQKARSYPQNLEEQKKLQRLVGALSRKGYASNVYTIAKEALASVAADRAEEEADWESEEDD